MTDRTKQPVTISIMTGNILLRAFEESSLAGGGHKSPHQNLRNIAPVDTWSYFAGHLVILSFLITAVDRSPQSGEVTRSDNIDYHPFVGILSDLGVNYILHHSGKTGVSLPFEMGMLDMAQFVARTLNIT